MRLQAHYRVSKLLDSSIIGPSARYPGEADVAVILLLVMCWLDREFRYAVLFLKICTSFGIHLGIHCSGFTIVLILSCEDRTLGSLPRHVRSVKNKKKNV